MFKKIQILAVSVLMFIGIQTAFGQAVFSDITSEHPNYAAIMYLQENGIVEGYEDNTFRPNQLVNRAEILKIILLGSSILVPEIAEQEIFPDVMHGSWYAKFTAKAKNLGIVSGDSDTGMFRPGDTVNLAEAMKILLETNNIETEFPNNNPHPDVPSDAWFAPYFSYAESVSLLDQSSDKNVNPALPINRGMLAELMYRLTLKPQGYQEGVASYYGEAFHGRTTASGAIFDASALTCAHRTLPFGTMLKVTNLENNKSVVVEVTDRGPYAGENRIIDLSKAAFEEISALSRGLINVSIHPVSGSASNFDFSQLEANLLNAIPGACQEKIGLLFFSKSSFDNITLDNELPNKFLESEVLNLTGTTSSSVDEINAFIVDESSKQYSFSAPVNDGNFDLNIFFSEQGSFKIGIVPGQSGTSIVKEIDVIQDSCIKQSTNSSLLPPAEMSINLVDGDTKMSWNRGAYNLFKLVFAQGGNQKTFYISNRNDFKPNYKDLTIFEVGLMDITLQGAVLSSKSILEPNAIEWSEPATNSFNAVTHHEYIINDDQVEIIDIPSHISPNQTFEIVVKPKTDISADGAVILPNGNVAKMGLQSEFVSPTKNSNGIDVYTASNNELTLSYKPVTSGVHFAEINNADALAAINIPLYFNNDYPIIPNLSELHDGQTEDLGDDINAIRNQTLTLLNSSRNEHGKSNLIIDSSLNSLAQFRSDDMANNNYFSHWNEDGVSANDLRRNYAISQVVAENIAKEINPELAQYGLMRSATHRLNIISDEWTRVGFGISKHADGSYVFVQIFSANPIDLGDLNSMRTTILNAVNEKRGVNLNLQANLNSLAQDWSTNMTENDFFDFTNPIGTTLVDSIRDSGINASLGTFIIGNTSFQDAVEQIAENEQITKLNWLNLGLGIEQDSYGIIKVTIIYTE